MNNVPRRSTRNIKKQVSYTDTSEYIPKRKSKSKQKFKYDDIFTKYNVKDCTLIYNKEIVTDTQPIVFYIIGAAGSGKSTLYKNLFADIKHNYYNLDNYFEVLINTTLKEFKIDLIKRIKQEQSIEQQLAALNLQDITINTLPSDDIIKESFTDEEKIIYDTHVNSFTQHLLIESVVCAKKDLAEYLKSEQLLVIDTTGGKTFKEISTLVDTKYKAKYYIFVDEDLPIALTQNNRRKERRLDSGIVVRTWFTVNELILKNKYYDNRNTFYRYKPITTTKQSPTFSKIDSFVDSSKYNEILKAKQLFGDFIDLETLKNKITSILTSKLSITEYITKYLNKDEPLLDSTKFTKNVVAIPYIHKFIESKKEFIESENDKALQKLVENKNYNNVTIVWGRFQPPHIGHGSLFNQAYEYAATNNNDLYIMPSSSCDEGDVNCSNPLKIQDKLELLGQLYPNYNFLYLHTKQIFEVINVLLKVYTTVTLFCGPDRYNQYENMFKRQKDIKDKVIVKAYQDPDSNKDKRFSISITGFTKPVPVSASFVRLAAQYSQISILKELYKGIDESVITKMAISLNKKFDSTKEINNKDVFMQKAQEKKLLGGYRSIRSLLLY